MLTRQGRRKGHRKAEGEVKDVLGRRDGTDQRGRTPRVDAEERTQPRPARAAARPRVGDAADVLYRRGAGGDRVPYGAGVDPAAGANGVAAGPFVRPVDGAEGNDAALERPLAGVMRESSVVRRGFTRVVRVSREAS